MSNTSYAEIGAIDDVCVQKNVGYMSILKHVQHVPYLRLNLISTYVLDLNGYYNSFNYRQWKFTKCSIMVTKGKLGTHSTRLKWRQIKVIWVQWNMILYQTCGIGGWLIWMRKDCRFWQKKSLLHFSKGASLNSCDDCLYIKHNQIFFSSSSKRKKMYLN